MKSKFKLMKLAVYFLGVAILLQVIEYSIKQHGMELRTLLQIVKGVYIWLIVPVVIVIGICLDIIPKMTRYKWLLELAAVFGIIAILIASFLRGAVYYLEMVRETQLENGYIRGEKLTLFDSYFVYYDNVFGVLRKPFAGWNEDEMLQILHDRYGEGIKFQWEEPNGDLIYSASDMRSGSLFYFCVKNTFEAQSNFGWQLVKNDAVKFWGNRRRAYTFGDPHSIKAYDYTEEVKDTRSCPDAKDYLIVYCNLQEDIAACAADIADWYFYAIEDERYYIAGCSTPFNTLYVRMGTEEVVVFLSDFYYASPEDTLYTWERVEREIEQDLRRQLDADKLEVAQAGDESNQAGEEQAWGQIFMDNYTGDFEKECFLADGKIGYRMVVLDAACGSRMYGLLKSTDGGASWQMASGDPFAGQMGMGVDFTFLDEKFGFATLMHNGGDEAYLYVTEDGGLSYQSVAMQGITVTFDDGHTYPIYDYPHMPYEENGKLYVLCGQVMDSYYDSGDEVEMALYESTDGGHTFVFIETKKVEIKGY